MVAKTFPATHKRAGEPTHFADLIEGGVKIHTIRGNYNLWANRVAEINEGKAILSVREWTGKPYNSPPRELWQAKEIGIQKIELTCLGFFIDDVDSDLSVRKLAGNDGLNFDDFKAWFKDGFKLNEPMAIIHFTRYRY